MVLNAKISFLPESLQLVSVKREIVVENDTSSGENATLKMFYQIVPGDLLL